MISYDDFKNSILGALQIAKCNLIKKQNIEQLDKIDHLNTRFHRNNVFLHKCY